jgi:mRNA interferase HigB
VRIIKETFLVEAARQYPKAARYLEAWRAFVRQAHWTSFADVRRVYGSADTVQVESGRAIVVFNVCGNAYRLIVAIHYNVQIVYTLRFLTHAEYSKDKWKNEL